jgi:hypothetical protein
VANTLNLSRDAASLLAKTFGVNSLASLDHLTVPREVNRLRKDQIQSDDVPACRRRWSVLLVAKHCPPRKQL